MLVNALKAEIASRLTASGMLLNVLTASAIVGATLSEKLFQDAYDEHAHRLARLYEHVGEAP
jgi:uncharacterized protein (UPF0212 family)